MAENKVSKKSVDYSRGMAKSHCGICEFYDNRRCEKVEGPIDPDMWCELFKKATIR